MAKIHSEDFLFGGDWTQDKLQRLQSYLRSYCQIFKPGARGSYFRTIYVDAFAGTGYLNLRPREMPLADLIPELAISAEAAAEYSKGSAVRALEIDPGFAEYVFIERDARRAAELEELRRRFSTKVIQVVNSDAAQALSQWLSDTDWRKNRAVMFLDPFGMQVEWSLVQAIAATRAIDLWMLFPIFAVNRMLARSGRLPDSWREKLNRVFGTEDWEQKFYISQATLLDGITATEKVANIALIQEFLLDRLRSVFSAVADPLTLYNSRGSPLFLLCFAAGNPKGAPTALRIAQHLIGRK